ncbi:MAG: Gfo/Idh/MocA family protein [Clostridium sp.]
MKTLNWAILGPGAMGEQFAQGLINNNSKIYGVGSRSLDRAKTFGDKFNVEKVFGSYDEMLNDENIDIVYISTPHSNHYEYIIKSLNKNKHVLCEKAITVNSKELQETINLAKEKGLILAEAMTIFHMPLFDKIKTLIDSNSIGKLKMIQVSFGSCKENDINNRFFNMNLAGGALLDIGTYALSFARFFMSETPNEVLTTCKKFITGADEQSGIILKNAQDEMAVISLTMRAKMPKRGIIACEDAFITIDDFPRAETATITYLNGNSEVISTGSSSDALKYEISTMENIILNNATNNNLELSSDVISIMDEVRCQWNLKYPFE